MSDQTRDTILAIVYIGLLAISGILAFFAEGAILETLDLTISFLISTIIIFAGYLIIELVSGISFASDGTLRLEGRFMSNQNQSAIIYGLAVLDIILGIGIKATGLVKFLATEIYIQYFSPESVGNLQFYSLLLFIILILIGGVYFYIRFK